MATGGLYGSSGTGALIAQPGSESSGLYGNSTSFGGTYFEWFVFQTSETQPATPTGGTWNFTTNANTPPTGWSSAPPSNPLNTVWVSIAIVNSKNTAPLVWSVPGKFAFSSGLPILFGDGAPQPGDGQSDQLYVQLDTTPQTIWAKETGTWTRLTGSTLYADLTSNQTIAGTKTFSSQIQGSISGTASNVTGTVAISNGGTGATTAASARAALGAAELGANADITSMTGVTGGISTPDFVQFDTGITPTVGVGKLQWDPTHGCMQVGLVGGNVNLQIGEETVAYVYNNTGSTIAEGQVVRVVGSQGQRLTVALAQADGDPNSATILGMATENIANNSSGFITTQGVVNNLNTNGFADGTLLYLSPTVPGGVTATKPVAPQHLVWIGYVVKGNSGGAGSIYIHTQNGYELDELHNVKITDPVADNSFLVYDATLEVWQNEAPSAARTSLGLGSAAVLNAGSANGVATLDAGGTVPLSQIPASIQGGVSYQGTWNATTNTPTLTSSVGTKGYYYVVSVAGSTNLNGITSWNIGDWAIYNGTAWEKIDNTDAVTSVNGYTGTVVLNYADVGAPSTTGVNATGTWGINVTGNAATATTAGSATTATTATNVSGGTASVTTLTTSSTVTLNGGTANGVAYLNGSKVLTTGSALTYNGTGLGVGVASALSKLHISSNTASTGDFAGSIRVTNESYTAGTYAGVLFETADTLNSYITGVRQASYAGQIAFGVNTGGSGTSLSEQMRLTSTGLGIGTSSPAGRLTLRGAAGTSGKNQGILLEYSNGTEYGAFGLNNGSGWPQIMARAGAGLTFHVNSDLLTTGEAMRLDSSGNLGLGVTPSAWASGYRALQVGLYSGLAYEGGKTFVTTNTYNNGTNWIYANSDFASRYQQQGGSHYFYTAPSGTAGNAISFTQAMTLDASGRLGVGTTSPATRLTLQATHAAPSGTSYTGAFLIHDEANGVAPHFNAGVAYDGGGNYGWIQVNSSGGTYPLVLQGVGGNVGIGTTIPAEKLHVTTGTTYAATFNTTVTTSAITCLSIGGYTNASGGAGGSVVIAGVHNHGATAQSSMAFYTHNGSSLGERARIDSSGNLLVGTTSNPNASHQIWKNNPNGIVASLQNTNTTNGFVLDLVSQSTAGTGFSLIRGYVTSGATQVFAVQGNGNVVNTNGSYGAISDAKLKENVTDATPKLEKLQQVRVVNYNLIGDEHKQIGVIAQELEQIFPGMVEESPDRDAEGNDLGTTTKSVKYSVFVPMLIKAIQEQQAIISGMKAEIDALKAKVGA